MNKNRIIFILFLGLLAIAFLATYLAPKNATNTDISPVPTSIPVLPTTINSKKLNISGVETKDFTANPISSTSEGNLTFAETQDYQITYLPAYSLFIINVFTTDSSARHAAEAELLNKLNISQEAACKLTVRVGQKYSAGLPETQSNKLSFCQ